MKIFCDLDGTLIDVLPRHYTVYQEVVAEFKGIPIAKDTYWDLKRKKMKWAELLPLSQLPADIEPAFLESFIKKIEDPVYLKLDTLFPGAVETLDTLSSLGERYLVSLRRNRENLLEELERLDLARHFSAVLTGHSENDGYDVKIALIKGYQGVDEGVIIGDTEADVVTGKELGLMSFAVTSGIRDEKFLAALQPDHLVAGINDVVAILKSA